MRYPRGRAALLIERQFGLLVRQLDWLGYYGGDHILRAKNGEYFRVDLVIEKVTPLSSDPRPDPRPTAWDLIG